MRVCRSDYHTESALHEELSWFCTLGETKKFQVPVPITSKEKVILETVSSKEIPNGRRIALFHWTDGRFLKKTISEKQMQEVGYWMARMHEQVRGIQVKSRRYWDAEGLVGKSAKFGSIESLPDVTKAQQKIISQARKDVFKKLTNFEKRFPDKLGLIHADMHTGNFLFNKNGLAAIDFDDCGFGFFWLRHCHSIDVVESI